MSKEKNGDFTVYVGFRITAKMEEALKEVAQAEFGGNMNAALRKIIEYGLPVYRAENADLLNFMKKRKRDDEISKKNQTPRLNRTG